MIARATEWTRLLAAAACVLTFVPDDPACRQPARIRRQRIFGFWPSRTQSSKYDVATFAPTRTLKVPRRLLDHPEYLSVDASGQMLYVPPPGVHGDGGDAAVPGDRAWFWDGQRAREWALVEPDARGRRPQDPPLTETARQWFLSFGRDSLFLFENRFDTAPKAPR